MSAPRVAVIGGGLAGITAALDCAAAGMRVTLLEVRPRLGGAAYSFARDGLQLDNGQHVFLRCCTAYRALLQRIGSADRVRVQERLEIPVLRPGGDTAILRRSALPAPLHLAWALARYRHLSARQRLRAARAAAALGGLKPDEPRLDQQTFGAWLAAHGQDQRAIAALWDLICLPTLNLPAGEASLALAAFVFKTALLDGSEAGDIGFHARPLSEVIGAPALAELRRCGVEVRLGWRAQTLRRAGDGLEVTNDRDDLSAEAVIVAIPHQRAAALLAPLLGQAAGRLAALGHVPIVNLHLVYDRCVCDFPFAAGVETPVQYLFDRSAAAGLSREQYLAISLSGAGCDARLSADELRARYLPAMHTLLPRTRQAKLEAFIVSREHKATFRAAPGVARLRPAAATAVPGLTLAGAWVDTGWPATLEGAVMSGHAAAAAALKGLQARC